MYVIEFLDSVANRKECITFMRDKHLLRDNMICDKFHGTSASDASW